MFKGLTIRFSTNPLHDGVRNLTGIKKVASSKDYQFSKIKKASQNHGMTINNLVMTCLSATLKEYFEQEGDTKTD
jgi:hypothetical protein